MRYAHNVGTGYSEWAPLYEDRLPRLADAGSVVAYVVDNFNLLCESFQPDIFISWNKYDPIFGLPYELAVKKRLPVFDMERALIPHWVSLGLEFKQSGKQISRDFEAKGRLILEKYPSAHIRKQRRVRLKAPQRNRKTILVLGSWDAVSDRSANFYRDSNDMAACVARDLPGWHVIFKPHPLAVVSRNPASNLEISNANPTKLIADSDVVVTSGTKLELDVIQSDKPLVLCGGGFLANSGAGIVSHTHEATIEAVKTVDLWHHPEKSMEALAAFVGYEASHSWYSLSSVEEDTQSLEDLLGKFLEVEPTEASRPDLHACMLNYHAAFVNRYHRSGISDFSNRELLKELMKRIKLKMSHGI